jgi:hypothetical protein
MNPTERAAYVEEMRQLAQRLLDEARGADRHGMMLDALLMAFMSVARGYPCCTEGAGHALIQHAHILLDMAYANAQAQPPVSQHLH